MPDYMPPPSGLQPGAAVWAYLRDSGGPGQEQSVPQQEAEIRAFCKHHGLALARIFSDVGKSAGSVKDRAHFLDMIDLCEDQTLRPAGLLVWNFARFSRDVDDSDYYKSTLRRQGIIIHSLTDPIPEGQWAGVVEKIIDISNEEKRRQNSRDVKRALENLVRQGYAPGGTPPRGYISVPVTIGLRKDGRPRIVSRWEPDPELWELVKLAWRMRAEGKPFGEITRATQGKIYTNKNCWVTFFKNKSYLGIGKCGVHEYPDHHAAAITMDIWEAVQEIQRTCARRGLRHPRRVAHPSLLSGLARCGECGAAMIYHAAGNRNWPFYICGNHDLKLIPERRCNSKRISARKVDPLILDLVLNRILTPRYFEELRQELRKQLSDTAAIKAEIDDRLHDLRLAERAVENLLELAETFGIESALARLKLKEAERARLAAEVRILEGRLDALNLEITPEALALVFDTWRAEIREAQRAGDLGSLRGLLSRFISKIELTYTAAKVWYTFPLDGLIQSSKSPQHGGT